MPLQLSPADAATLAALPEVVRVIVTRDLEAQEHARHLAAINEAAREHAAASFAAHPANLAIARLNAQIAAQQPGPRPRPPATPPAAATSPPPPAMQTIARHNRAVESRAAAIAAAVERALRTGNPTPIRIA
jgi:hypothetical protein